MDVLTSVMFKCTQLLPTNACFSSKVAIGSGQANIRELSICKTHGFCDSKISNVASSPQWLSGPLPAVELGGPTDDKFDTCANE